MRSVLVTGATGFLGGAVARDLHQRGWRVIATGRRVDAGLRLASEGIEFRTAELDAPGGRGDTQVRDDALGSLVAGCDVVVHCAALAAPWGRRSDFIAANVTATRRVVSACRQEGVRRLVHISSPSVLAGSSQRIGLDESTPWEAPPLNHYVATKRSSETLVRQAAQDGLDAIVLRPRALFGPGDTTLIPRVMRAAGRGRFPLFGDGDPLLDLTWIEDAVAAVRLAAEAPAALRGRIYHVTSGDPRLRSRIFAALFEAADIPVRYRTIPVRRARILAAALEGLSMALTLGRWEPPLTRYAVNELALGHTLDISAARRDLGYDPATDVLERLRETAAGWRGGGGDRGTPVMGPGPARPAL